MNGRAALAVLLWLGALPSHAMGRAEAPEATAEPAEGSVFPEPDEQPVKAELIAEHASIQPGGKTRIGVLFEMEPEWHIYADPPGDSGLATRIAWTAPKALVLGPIAWPAPMEFFDPGEIRTFGYSGAVVLWSHATLSAEAAAGSALPVSADVRWLACKDICLPGSARLELQLPVASEPPQHSAHAEHFEHVNLP